MALRRGLSECARVLFRRSVESGCFKCKAGAKRHLLSEDYLRLQHFQQVKLDIARRMTGPTSHYFDTFNQNMEKNQLIQRNDLKLLLHLCQAPEDMVTVRKAIYRYHQENQNKDYKFGPLFLRLCYELCMEDVALATITDKTLKGFFSDGTSFNIMIDMLFTKGSYESALEVLWEMKNQGVHFTKDTFTLAFATCYKLNTPKSYSICLTLKKDGEASGSYIPIQALCCAVALALKQNDTKQAQAIYSQILHKNSRLCQNVKVLMLILAGSPKVAVANLKTALLSNRSAFERKLQFSKEVVNLLREKSVGKPWEMEAEEVVKKLQQAGQVTELSMDDLLCHTPPEQRTPHIFDVRKKRMANIERNRGHESF